MPSRNTSGTRASDRPTFDRLKQEIGEDPARFLCSDMPPWPMIRGMTDPQRASAWLAVARNIDADTRVIEALKTTVETLREGENA